MDAKYVGYTFTVSPIIPGVEILIAQLAQVGFESFVESETGVAGYIQKEDWREDILETIQILASDEFAISYELEHIEQTNWNAAWESNFNPIIVDDRCMVRAPFHEPANCEYDIVIEPKMSFGTGHHATTHMMIQYILENDWNDKDVLDMGCGTSVLAILAKKRGARQVDAIDIDEWCYKNSQENIERNDCLDIRVQMGDIDLVKGRTYHTIIANINRNILINQMSTYASCLVSGGQLYLSGFLTQDLEQIKLACNKHGGRFVQNKEREGWIAAKFVF
ncbi:MAG: 50S ribosomal protein L11 methyltransferase [Gilvibacter sp.]